MIISKFITEYSEARMKEECIKKHIITKYLPYEQKMAICKNIIESADYTPFVDVVEKKYYCPNTPMRYVLFCMSIVDAYTDIELEQIDSGRDVMGGFNQLDSNGVFEVLFKELCKEYNTMTTVLEMMENDYYNKENCLVGFLSSKIDSIKGLYDATFPYIEKKLMN